MNKTALREQLSKLHAELIDAHQADPRYREGLAELMQNINRLIDAADSASSADATLRDRLERVAVQFEVAHPTLAASVRRLVDLLGEVGI
jgi:phosphoglycerate-specific signal transduction histidine kinase